jgi:hypothetical protein
MNRPDDPQEYEIDITLDPCSEEEAYELMMDIHNFVGDRLNAMVSMVALKDLEL